MALELDPDHSQALLNSAMLIQVRIIILYPV